MKQYLDLCRHILDHGIQKNDRTGTGTLSIFGYQMRFDLSDGMFPLLTTKDMSGKRFAGIVHELLWFLSGGTNIRYLLDRGVNIWNRDAYRWYLARNSRNPSGPLVDALTYEEYIEAVRSDDAFAQTEGDLGPIYGTQWRSWRGAVGVVDQIRRVIHEIKTNPDSRRLIVSAWNADQIDQMALPPCHVLFQFYVADGKLSCHLYQRSGDVFLGVPYNIASYSLLLMMIAQVTGLKPGEFIHTLGDAHLYNNHITQVRMQLEREPRKPPVLLIDPNVKDIDEFRAEHFVLTEYDPHPPIQGVLSVG